MSYKISSTPLHDYIIKIEIHERKLFFPNI